MSKMSEDELRRIIDQEVTESSAWTGSTLAQDREKNLSYYHGLPMGNEVDGRSQVVSWDVFEVIESTLPSLLEPFFAGDHICEFEPVTQEDEQYAEQATDYINYLIKKKNDGFITFNTWIKDGLLSKVGIVRCWWDDTHKTKKESYKGLTDQQLTKIVQDAKIKIMTHDAAPDPDDAQHRAQAQQALQSMPPEQQQQVMQMLQQPPQMLHDIDVVVDSGPRGARIDNVPPEAFILSRRAKKLADVTVIGELRRYTRSDLAEMGYKKGRIAELSEYDVSLNHRDLLTVRDEDRNQWQGDDAADEAMQQITLFFGFIRVDYDGDGIAEWRRVFMGGNDLLENEEVDDHEYCVWSPILLPHRIIGMGYAEPIIEIQNIKTALTRQYLDSLYIANNPTTFALDGQVNLDDLLSTRIGHVVRMKQIGAAGPMQTAVVANESLQGIELADTMREGRLGVTRYTQGIDADSLHKTAAGANQFLSQAQMRTKMALRIFAETGVKDLCKKMLKLTCEYQDKLATIKMRGKWVDYDPRTWSDEMDVNINVGLGTGDKSQTVQFLTIMAPFFAQAAAVGVVNPHNVYELGRLLLKSGGVQGGESKLLTDPATIPPSQPQKSPEQTLAEAELQVEQLRQQGKANDTAQQMQLAHAKLQADSTLKALDLQIKDKEVRIKEIELGLKNIEMQHSMAQDKQNNAMKHHGQLHGQQLAQHKADLANSAQQHSQTMDHVAGQRQDAATQHSQAMDWQNQARDDAQGAQDNQVGEGGNDDQL